MSETFAEQTFRDSPEPRNFCIFEESLKIKFSKKLKIITCLISNLEFLTANTKYSLWGLYFLIVNRRVLIIRLWEL